MTRRIVIDPAEPLPSDRFAVRFDDRSVSALSEHDLDRLRREVRAAVRSAIRKGGAHTGRSVGAREREGVCPRDGSPLARGRFGGRTTYWCPVCQR